MVETLRVEAEWFWRRRHVREWRLVRRGTDTLMRDAIAPLTVWREIGRSLEINRCRPRSPYRGRSRNARARMERI